MSSIVTGSSMLLKPRIIPNFVIDRETLEHLKQTSPLHYFVAIACINDGRWKLNDQQNDLMVTSW